MDVKVYRMNTFSSNVKAFVDLIIADSVIIKGFSLVEGKNGLFLSHPSAKDKKDGKYYDTVRFQTVEQKQTVENLVIEHYNQMIANKEVK